MIRFYLRFFYYEIISLLLFFKLRNKNYHSYQISFSHYDNLFNKLCIKYGTDKGFDKFQLTEFYGARGEKSEFCYPHIYSKFYNDLFFPVRKNIKLVFECGIGSKTRKKKFVPGASLKVWRDFFPNAKIFGADINKKLLFTSKNIKTFYVDQTDKKSIQNLWKNVDRKQFDIIVDDGLHTHSANILLFENSIKFLRQGGIYIIEDVNIQSVAKYKKYFYKKNFKFELINFNNLNYSNHFLIKITK